MLAALVQFTQNLRICPAGTLFTDKNRELLSEINGIYRFKLSSPDSVGSTGVNSNQTRGEPDFPKRIGLFRRSVIIDEQLIINNGFCFEDFEL